MCKGLIFSVYLMFIFLITGCDKLFEQYEEKFLNCVFDIMLFDEGPVVISTEYLEIGSLGVNYIQEISSEIRNEPSDDDYIYEYTYNVNQLPAGLSFRESGRKLYIEGVPQVIGNFRLDIKVFSPTLETIYLEDTSKCTGIPETYDSQVYVLTIQ